MHIKTKDGWKPLTVITENKIVEAPERYRGPIPFYEAKSYWGKLERAHHDWVTKRSSMQEEK